MPSNYASVVEVADAGVPIMPPPGPEVVISSYGQPLAVEESVIGSIPWWGWATAAAGAAWWWWKKM